MLVASVVNICGAPPSLIMIKYADLGCPFKKEMELLCIVLMLSYEFQLNHINIQPCYSKRIQFCFISGGAILLVIFIVKNMDLHI